MDKNDNRFIVFLCCCCVFILSAMICITNMQAFKTPFFKTTTDIHSASGANYEKDGRIYITDSGQFRLLSMMPDGKIKYIIEYNSKIEYTRIYNYAADTNSNLYVYEQELEYGAYLTKCDRIRQYDSEGNFVKDILVINYDDNSADRSHAYPQFNSLNCFDGKVTFSRTLEDHVDLYIYDIAEGVLTKSVFNTNVSDYSVLYLSLLDFNHFLYSTRDGNIYEVKNDSSNGLNALTPILRADFKYTQDEGGIIPMYVNFDSVGKPIFFDVISGHIYRIKDDGSIENILPEKYLPQLEYEDNFQNALFRCAADRLSGVHGNTVWVYEYDNDIFQTYKDNLVLPSKSSFVNIFTQFSLIAAVISLLIGVYLLFRHILNGRVSLFFKHIAVNIPITIAAFIFLYTIMTNELKAQFDKWIYGDMLSLAIVSSKFIDGNAIGNIRSTDDFNSEAYKKLEQTLVEIIGDNKDSWNRGYYSAIYKITGGGNEYKTKCLAMSNHRINMFRTGISVQEGSGEWALINTGKPFYSTHTSINEIMGYANAPIYDSTGNLAGIMEIGIDLFQFAINNQKHQQKIIWTTALLISGLTIVIVFLMWRIVRRLRNINNVLFAIRNGDYGNRVKCGTKDELDEVCNGLNQMACGVEAKIDAEQANRAKSVFLAAISHEIRTPLNTVLSLSEIELQNKLPEGTHSNLEKIYNSGSTLLSIINNILDISKIETGNLGLTCGEYDTPSLLYDTVQLNIVRIGSKPITFSLHIDETIPDRMYGDELRLKQILNNLLSNAIKYTSEGTIIFQIGWEKIDDRTVTAEKQTGIPEKNCFLTFTVRDTGIGIKKEDMPKLFSDYTQLDKNSTRNAEGPGLGLVITKKLVDMMGGYIEVESEYGKGSNFFAKVKQGIVTERHIGKDFAKKLETIKFIDPKQNHGKNLVRSWMPYGKVLVVDDVPTNLDVATGLLMPYGLFIDCVSSGKEAIEKIRKEEIKYDVIFMDHMMPEMDGIETTTIIRTEIGTDYAKNIPIIALNANAIAGNEEMFRQKGFNAFISKPIDIMRLNMVLNTWVRDKQSPETLKKAAEEEIIIHEQLNKTTKTEGLLSNLIIDGINVLDGINQYGNETSYIRILNSYVKHTPELLKIIGNTEEDNIGAYTIAIHGLKTSSRVISANETCDLAEKLEIAAKNSNIEYVKANTESFISEVERLIKEIDLSLELKNDYQVRYLKDSPDPELLKELLAAVKEFKSMNMISIIEELEKFDYKTGGDLIEWLREQIDNLEYDAIVEKLSNI